MNFYSIAPFIQEFYPEYYSIETYPVSECVAIRKVKEFWGILGNFAPTPIVINNVTFKTSELLFQLMKFKDEEPVKAVFRGKIIVDAMKFCLTKKYEQSEDFRKELERSIGKYIVEDQTSFPKKTPDTWGVKQQGDNYVGPNLLGRLLMELRDNGKLEYKLPDDAFTFLQYLK